MRHLPALSPLRGDGRWHCPGWRGPGLTRHRLRASRPLLLSDLGSLSPPRPAFLLSPQRKPTEKREGPGPGCRAVCPVRVRPPPPAPSPGGSAGRAEALGCTVTQGCSVQAPCRQVPSLPSLCLDSVQALFSLTVSLSHRRTRSRLWRRALPPTSLPPPFLPAFLSPLLHLFEL